MEAFDHEELTSTAEMPISSTLGSSADYGSTATEREPSTVLASQQPQQQQQRQVVIVSPLNTENPTTNYQDYVETRFSSSVRRQQREGEERQDTHSKNRAQFNYQSLTNQPSSCDSFEQSAHSKQAGRFVKIPRTPAFIRMTDNKFGHHSHGGILLSIEKILNIVNHGIIAFITIYMSWMCLRTGLAGTALHAWLVTIGFVFLMAEGVMCHYPANILTLDLKRDQKTRIHWILQSLGGGLGIAGVLVKIIQKGLSLKSTHAKLGFAALILCGCSLISGLSALYSMRLKNLLSPLCNKTIHNYIGVAALSLALFAQFFGYSTGYFMRKTEEDFQTFMKLLTLILLVLSSIGPLRAITNKSLSIVRQYR